MQTNFIHKQNNLKEPYQKNRFIEFSYKKPFNRKILLFCSFFSVVNSVAVLEQEQN